MPVNLSIKNVPDALAESLRARAERNHRSLQGELMSLLEEAAGRSQPDRVEAAPVQYGPQSLQKNAPAPASADTGRLLERLRAIAGERGVDAARRLGREQAHDRTRMRKSGI
jgi:plasmid stability protein